MIIDPDDGEIDTEADDDLDEVPEPPPPPLLRSKDYYKAHPHKTEKATGTSSWVGRPRDGFTSTMAERATEMSSSREGRKVGTTAKARLGVDW